MFQKMLIANRGEIALRVLRACRELGISTVAVHSSADADALYVKLADESVCIGPPAAKDSYLNIPAIISAAEITGADSIHPGYGFLAENAKFAQIVREHNITFIGPEPEHIKRMGDKILAKKAMKNAGLELIPGSENAAQSFARAKSEAARIGFPLLIKATAGGGGRGMMIAEDETTFESAYHSARSEARAAFGNDSLYLERYMSQPRHIEIQIVADTHGNVAHLGERDCSLQRRHQKLLEEAPSPALSPAQRRKIGAKAVEAVKKIGYVGVGTVEFLYEDGHFYFIEMNTRLQVEHPVTEMVTGIDIVREQIRVAAGEKLSFSTESAAVTGHAIECRINAEDPWSFIPSPGPIHKFHAPGGFGVRFDSAIYTDYVIPPFYDSMIGKLIVHADDRNACLAKLRVALGELTIIGPRHTGPLFSRLLSERTFIKGSYKTRWLEEWIASLHLAS